jgi:adenylate cyclase
MTALGTVSMANDRAALQALLHRYNSHPQEREQIIREIEERFLRPTAVLVIDTCGFSRSVRSTGIVAFLALLERLTDIVRPDVERCDGCILYSEADNIFITFPHPDAALRCAVEIRRDVRVENDRFPDDEHVYVSMGIGYGELLVVAEETVYGDEMNLACKLGEDLAEESDVLLTPAAYGALGAHDHRFEAVHFSISGLSLTAYRLLTA